MHRDARGGAAMVRLPRDHPESSMKRIACLLFACLLLSPMAQAKDFLRTQGARIVDAGGKPVILRGMGLGGWMLQEGYMLDVYKRQAVFARRGNR